MNFLFIFFLVFQNILLRFFDSTSLVNYWDEVLVLVLVLIATIGFLGGKARLTKNDLYIVIALILSIVSGCIGNYISGMQTSGTVVFRDIIGFIKFPAAFVCIRITNLDNFIAYHIRNKSVLILKFITFIMFICSIVSLFANIGMSQNDIRNGLLPFQFLYSHPTYLVLSCVMILAILDANAYSSKMIAYEFMLLIIILLSLRTKGFAVVSAYLVIKYGKRYIHRYRWILWVVAAGVVIYTGIGKIKLYFTYSGSPRQSLYEGAFYLLRQYFPFGSGFGTFGSMLSAISGSAVYNILTISGGWTNGQVNPVIGDAGYSYYIGQFGMIGTILFTIMLFLIMKISTEDNDKTSGLLLMMYLLIALTTEATTLNAGTEFGVVLAVVISMSKINRLDEKKT